jgi:hypothetical protein
MSASQPTSGSSPIEILTGLLAGLPDSPEDIRALKAALDAPGVAFDPVHDPLALTLERSIQALRDRNRELKVPPPVPVPPHAPVRGPAPSATETPPPLPEPVRSPTRPFSAFHEQATMMADAVPTPARPPAAAVRWTPTDRMLYEDVMALFELGDHAGALTSLERLIMLSPRAEELGVFMDKNGETLTRLYQDHFGSLDRVPVPIKDARPIPIPGGFDIVMDLLQSVDGHRTIRQILTKFESRISHLHLLATISHLTRCGFIEVS